jgi:RimJ/RimL family protein N-acetyltransferase
MRTSKLFDTTQLPGYGVSPMKQLTTAPSQRLRLKDGRAVMVRPLERCDRAEIAAAIGRLSPQSRYLRFATAKPRLSERELDHLVDVDHHSREALAAFDPVTGRGIAVVRYVELSGEPGAVEIAATVADEWQGRGLGGALLARLAERARDEGHYALRASTLAENHRSVAMLQRAGFKSRAGSGVLREYELRLDLPAAPGGCALL